MDLQFSFSLNTSQWTKSSSLVLELQRQITALPLPPPDSKLRGRSVHSRSVPDRTQSSPLGRSHLRGRRLAAVLLTNRFLCGSNRFSTILRPPLRLRGGILVAFSPVCQCIILGSSEQTGWRLCEGWLASSGQRRLSCRGCGTPRREWPSRHSRGLLTRVRHGCSGGCGTPLFQYGRLVDRFILVSVDFCWVICTFWTQILNFSADPYSSKIFQSIKIQKKKAEIFFSYVWKKCHQWNIIKNQIKSHCTIIQEFFPTTKLLNKFHSEQ